MPTSPTEYEILLQTSVAHQQAKQAGRRVGPVLASTMQLLGCTEGALYGKMKKQLGYVPKTKSGGQRKRRSNAGTSKLSAAELKQLAGVIAASTNKKGQRMPVSVAREALYAGGQLAVSVSDATISRQLHKHGMHPKQMALPTASVQLRSKHPNHVWQCDSTTGSYYYMPQGLLGWMPDDQFYKNKVHNLVKVKDDLLTRYAATDHASGAFKVRYYLGGETAANLLDFLTWAMWKQPQSPMHGVPFILMMDPGAANRSHVVQHFCKRLGVELRHHATGAARVTGSVEKTHDLVRMHYETRLRFENPALVTIERLNESIGTWTAAFCASRKHGRTGRTRYGAWMEIEPAQLRAAASLEVLREAAVKEPETRRVANDRTITFGRPSQTYDLSLVPGVVAGLRVTVVQNPFRAPAIDVQFICPSTAAETWHVVEPAEFDRWGFRVDGPVIGEEMRTAAHSAVDHMRNDLMRDAYRVGNSLPTLEEATRARKNHAQAYAGIVDVMADVKATPVPAYLPRRAAELQMPERTLEPRRFTVAEACHYLMQRLGSAYKQTMYGLMQQRFPAGVPEDQLPALVAELGADATPMQWPLSAQETGT